MFDRFSENLKSGERSWWDQCTPEFIQGGVIQFGEGAGGGKSARRSQGLLYI